MGSAPIARRSLALLLGLMALEPARAAGFGGMLGASTDSVFRGISESNGDPAVQADVHYRWDGGAFVGLRGASTKPRTAAGPRDTLEVDTYLGYGFSPAAAWSARVTLVHYAYPWSEPERPGYDELAVSATWLGRVSLAAATSPNKPGAGGTRDAAHDYELALRWPLAGKVSLDAGLGYYDLRRTYDTAYVYWSAGATYAPQPLTLALSWIGADREARDGYGELADNRVVASVLWAF